jgi:hypothetical protein
LPHGNDRGVEFPSGRLDYFKMINEKDSCQDAIRILPYMKTIGQRRSIHQKNHFTKLLVIF